MIHFDASSPTISHCQPPPATLILPIHPSSSVTPFSLQLDSQTSSVCNSTFFLPFLPFIPPPFYIPLIPPLHLCIIVCPLPWQLFESLPKKESSHISTVFPRAKGVTRVGARYDFSYREEGDLKKDGNFHVSNWGVNSSSKKPWFGEGEGEVDLSSINPYTGGGAKHIHGRNTRKSIIGRASYQKIYIYFRSASLHLFPRLD